jgi:hypothetical protein
MGLPQGQPLRLPDNNVNEHDAVAGLWWDIIIFCVTAALLSCAVVGLHVSFEIHVRDRNFICGREDPFLFLREGDTPTSNLLKCLLHNIRSYFSWYVHCKPHPVFSFVVNTVFSPDIKLSYSHDKAGSDKFDGVLTYFTLHTSGYG